MEIEVGDYIRIDSDFRLIALGIGKVIKINQDTIYVKMNLDLPISLKIENVTKHSKNIIDLIELYDYVNGMIVFDIITYDNGEKAIKISSGYLIDENEIQDILTHEQYKANCYTVERKSKE